MNKKINKFNNVVITTNKKSYYHYLIIKEIEAGLVLEGWEVKSIRAGKVDISNSYVIFKNKEAFLLGTNFTPLKVASTHFSCNPTRIRKLLLNKYELNSIDGHVHRDGFTLIALFLFWSRNWCKIKIGIAKGKKQYDKRFILKKREWEIDKSRIIKYIDKFQFFKKSV